MTLGPWSYGSITLKVKLRPEEITKHGEFVPSSKMISECLSPGLILLQEGHDTKVRDGKRTLHFRVRFINMTPDVCVQRATEWNAKFIVSKDGKIEISETEDIEMNTGNNNGRDGFNDSALLDSEIDPKIPEIVSEQELNKQYSESKDVLEMCNRLEVENTAEFNTVQRNLVEESCHL